MKSVLSSRCSLLLVLVSGLSGSLRHQANAAESREGGASTSAASSTGNMRSTTAAPVAASLATRATTPYVVGAQLSPQLVGSSLLDFAFYATGTGCGAAKLGGNAVVDSFDSSKGTYEQ